MSGSSYANYATGNVSGAGTGTGTTNAQSLRIGGLIGEVELSGSEHLRSSYATGNVSGSGSGVRTGGLIGQVQVTDANSVSAVYAMGAVSNTSTGSTAVGGLAAYEGGSATPIANSYWDTQTTGLSSTAGTSTSATGAQTTSALQSPTGYTGSIYANWNQNLDGETGNDDPWYFGATNQYPVLKYAGLDTTAQLALQPSIPPRVAVTSNGDTLYVHWRAASQATGYTVQWKSGMQSYDAAREATPTATFLKIPLASGTTYTVRIITSKTGARDGSVEVMRATGLTNYDTDGDGLIAITTLAQLNAMRWDINGDGAIDASASTADTTAYNTAFPNRDTATRMGCFPGCTGYELLANLDFDENNDGAITSADATYWNGGAGWAPIGSSNTSPYTATFEGNGKTISHLYINRYVNFSGFFASTDTTTHIRSLGLVNAVINTGQGTVGALVGLNKGRIAASYVTGSVTANTNVGGLAGATQRGSYIVASYATASVVCNQSGPWSTGGGLVGANGPGATIASSYSTGSVTGACLHKHGLAENSGTVTDSYWDTQTSDIADDSDTGCAGGQTDCRLTIGHVCEWHLCQLGRSDHRCFGDQR